jgi:hypothetical protein
MKNIENSTGSNVGSNVGNNVSVEENNNKENYGRYVKLTVPRKECLNIAELEIYSGSSKISKGKKVTASSIEPSTKYENLNDDNLNSIMHTICNVDNPWVMIDLGKDEIIDKIVIQNRRDCCQERIKDGFLEIIDSSQNVKWKSDPITPTGNLYEKAAFLIKLIKGNKIITFLPPVKAFKLDL